MMITDIQVDQNTDEGVKPDNMKSLYIHIPFCSKKCFYCSFVVVVSQEHQISDYMACLIAEASRYKDESLSSIYIGGGTPSKLPVSHLRELMAALRRIFDCRSVSEITIEANPEDCTVEKLTAIKECGIDRISLGIQTFDDDRLSSLGRNHDARCALEAAERIRHFNFRSVNMDLMFGFEGQRPEHLVDDLNRVISQGPHHISLYGLTIEPRSRFFAQGKIVSNDLQAELYALIQERIKYHGYAQYEVSNFSWPGHESRHNMNYWLGNNYIGLGIGAHSHQDGRRWWNITRLNDYIQLIKEGKPIEEGHELLSESIRMKEKILFGLRMNSGVSLVSGWESLKRAFNEEQISKIRLFIKEDLLYLDDFLLKVTEKGRLLLDEISAQLI